MSLSHTDSRDSDDEPTLAAKALIERFPDKAIEILEKYQPKEELKRCCARAEPRLLYYQVIAELRDRERNDDARSEQSRRRGTNGSMDSARPRHLRHSSSDTTTSPSIKESGSSASFGAPEQRITVAQKEIENDKILHGYYNPESYYLIRSKIVVERLEESTRKLSPPVSCQYNGKVFQCVESVELTWMKGRDKQTHCTIFLLIPELPGADIVIGGKEHRQHRPQDSSGWYSFV
jgi:hypothetical protein